MERLIFAAYILTGRAALHKASLVVPYHLFAYTDTALLRANGLAWGPRTY